MTTLKEKVLIEVNKSPNIFSSSKFSILLDELANTQQPHEK